MKTKFENIEEQRYSQNAFAKLVNVSRRKLQALAKKGILIPCKDGNSKTSICYYTHKHFEQLPAALQEYGNQKIQMKKTADTDSLPSVLPLFKDNEVEKTPTDTTHGEDSPAIDPPKNPSDDNESIPAEKLSPSETVTESTFATPAETFPNVDVKPSSVVAPTVAKKDFLPMTTAPNFDAIPQRLKVLPRWLCWQLRKKSDGKLTKVPMTPKNGKLVSASVTSSENWLTFDDAISWYNRGLCSGIGFALSSLSPKVCCVDVDHCFADGKLTDEASEVIKLCGNSFVEKSQSGEGIHVWFEDDDFDGGRRKGSVEVYAADRYIAMTGNHIQSSAADLLTVNGACRAVIGRFIGEREGNLFDEKSARAERKANDAAAITTESNAPLSDDDRRLADYFRSNKCREHDANMFDLFAGNVAKYFKSIGKPDDDSVADCDLMLKLLYYVGGEGSDVDIGQHALKVFGQSELAKREKWIQREDYRIRTLNAAFDIWNKNGRKACKPSSADRKGNADALIGKLKTDLSEVNKALADFDGERKAAIERLKNVEVFDNKTVFSEEILMAAAFAKLADRQAFSQFRLDVKSYGDKHKEVKVSVNDWLAEIKERAADIESRECSLKTRRNEIKAQIKSFEFVAADELLEGIVIPEGYSITSTGGIEKIAGEKSIPVCCRPVIITDKIFDTDTQNYMLTLAYMTTAGKWKKLAPTEKATIFNNRRLVDLANADLPVTSSNAALLVDYLYAFNNENENKFSLTKQVARCGWHKFGDSDFFIDPRRDCVIKDEVKNISVKVDDVRSDFAKHMKEVGSLEAWKKIYKLAKKSPVARLIVAASVAPILLKILGERNFLLYIYAPTRAGKTTALYLGASAVGSEKIIRSFDATKNGLAGAAADVNDYPFLVDEKQVADNRICEQMSNLIYALANGIGRTKLNRDSTLKKLQDWRTVAIMTGETLLLPDNATGGANTRLLTIKAPKEILPADVCKIIRDITPDNYGLALPLVINKVFEFGREKLRGVYKDLVDVFTAKYPALLPEYCRYMAVLTLADTLLNSALFGNTVTNEDGKTFTALEDATLCAKEIFKLIPTRAEIDDTPREKEFVRDVIGKNQNHFIGGNVEEKKIQGIWGKLKDVDGYTYITVPALRDACADGGFDYRKLVSDLIADGFFKPADTTKKGRKTPLDTVQKRLGEVNTRCYRIPNTIFDETE